MITKQRSKWNDAKALFIMLAVLVVMASVLLSSMGCDWLKGHDQTGPDETSYRNTRGTYPDPWGDAAADTMGIISITRKTGEAYVIPINKTIGDYQEVQFYYYWHTGYQRDGWSNPYAWIMFVSVNEYDRWHIAEKKMFRE